MPEEIQERLIEDEMKQSYMDYAMSVIVSRAIPDVRDGLKPVHRRVLYAMKQLGLDYNKAFKKSARIVGECFTKDTLVLTSSGLVPITSIERGDLAYTQNGVEEVSELYEMPKKDMVEIRLDNGISNQITKSQKFKVINKNLQFEWKEAKNLNKDDYVVIRAEYPKIRESVKLKVFNNKYIELNENVAYLLGQFLSDGWIEKANNRISFYSTSRQIIERISFILQNEFGYVPNIEDKTYEYQTKSGPLVQTLAYQIRINNRLLCSFLAETFNLVRKDAFTKEIPQQIFISPKGVIYSFISGLMDGDGSIHETRNIINYSSVSEKLINSLLLLTQQLGILGKKMRSRPATNHEINNRTVRSNYPCYSIEYCGEFAKRLSLHLNLSEERKAERIKRISLMKVGKSKFEIIPFAARVLFEELSSKHLGGGWYLDKHNKKFRLGIRYLTGAKIRYSKNLKEKGLRRSQILEWNIKEKLEKIGSPYLKFINEVFDKKLFFIKIKSIKKRKKEKTYDIQTGNSHEFIANGMVSHNCLGKYHPHGDMAVYDALVRMAQNFSLRYPLVRGQGNFGSQDGDNAASMRYTEAKLSKAAEEMLMDLDKDTVDFVDNFDNSEREPTVLPSKLPNLLINGSSGIAVGMTTNIPPHNIKEACDATIYAVDHPECTSLELMRFIKGPDFPTGGIILGENGIKSAYETGRGKLIVRAKAEIEDGKIIITEIPYMVNKSLLIENIAQLVHDKRIEGISDIRDESDRKGMRIVIEIKKNFDGELILNQLYKLSSLQTTFGVIMLSLVNNEPKVLNLKDTVKEFIVHRKNVVIRRTKFELDKAEKRAHILQGLKIALANIDPVVQLIKRSETVEIARMGLVERFNLTEIQANAILEMRLQRLTSLETRKIQEEFENLLRLIEELRGILADIKKIFEIIKKELSEIKNEYGDERKTLILDRSDEIITNEDLINEEDIVVTITSSGYAKQTSLELYRNQGRGGTGIIATTTKEEDVVQELFITSNLSWLLFFTNKGRVHWLKAYEIPEASRYAKGGALVNLLQLDEGEKVSAVLPIKEFDDKHSLIFVTKRGVLKKSLLSEYSNPRKGGINAINLKENDEVVQVRLTPGYLNFIIGTKNGQAVKFNEEDVRVMGRNATGVRGIKLRNDEVIGMEVALEDGDLLTVTENGYGKRTAMSEYRLIKRGGSGVKNINVTEKNGKVVGIKTVKDYDEIMCITVKGQIIRTEVNNISRVGRNSQGVILIRLKENDKVASVSRVVKNSS